MNALQHFPITTVLDRLKKQPKEGKEKRKYQPNKRAEDSKEKNEQASKNNKTEKIGN